MLHYPIDFLLCHGWAYHRRLRRWSRPVVEDFCFRQSEALTTLRNDNCLRAVLGEGWQVEDDRGQRPTVRSPVSMFVLNERSVKTVKNAFAYHRERGWRQRLTEPLVLPAFRRDNTCFAWCMFCDAWHDHNADRANLPQRAQCTLPVVAEYNLCVVDVVRRRVGKYVPLRERHIEKEDQSREKIAASLYRRSRSIAAQRGFDFNLDPSDVTIPDRCPYLGTELSLDRKKAKKQAGATFVSRWKNPCAPSLDRVDTSKGYVRGNVMVVSWRANQLKNNASLAELVAMGRSAERILTGADGPPEEAVAASFPMHRAIADLSDIDNGAYESGPTDADALRRIAKLIEAGLVVCRITDEGKRVLEQHRASNGGP